MKNQVKITTVYAMAFLLFFFGNAVNVIHFCCDVCRVHGTEVFTEDICHENPAARTISGSDNPDPETHDGAVCSKAQSFGFPFHLSHQHEACSLDRVSMTMESLYPNVKTHITTLIVDFLPIPDLKSLSSSITSKNSFIYCSSAIPIAGRQMLNRICVLRN